MAEKRRETGKAISFFWEEKDSSLAEEPVVSYGQVSLAAKNQTIGNMVLHFQSFGLSKQVIAAWLHVSSRQLERYIKDQPGQEAKESVVERMLLIDRLFRQGISTFEGEEPFVEWLKIPNYMLGGSAPVSLLKSYFGIEEVLHLLQKMEYSLPA